MINGAHAIIFSSDPEAARTFLRDVLKLGFVDDGGGWLIFQLPPAEVGVHPVMDGGPGGRHMLYLMCDDISETRAELQAGGVEFIDAITEARYGLVTHLSVPGAGSIELYEPRHALAKDLPR